LDINKIFKHRKLYTSGGDIMKKRMIDNKMHRCGHAGAVYGLGFIGAAVYYISQASGFWMGVLGFLKALVWPAFLVFELLKNLGM
jgi:hypothetical protein